MDDRRPINLDGINPDGYKLCKCGRFTLCILASGEFAVLDDTTGLVVEHLSSNDAHDLSDVAKYVEEWSGHHKIVKK